MAVLTKLRWLCRRQGRGSRGTAGFIAAALLGVLPLRAAAPATVSAEYQLKAVFLYNFAQFVEWPREVFAETTSPFVIGVLGENPFGSYLDDLVKGETVGGRALVIRQARKVEALADCHIIFIAGSETRDLEKILSTLQGKSALTVSDADSFTRQGGMVRFAMENGRIRLRINVDAARASHLTISSKILRPGTLATPGKD